MKRIYILSLAAAAVLSMTAQSKFDYSAALHVGHAKQNTIAKAKSRAGVEVRTLAPEIDPEAKVLVALTITDSSCIEEMQSMGFDLVMTEGEVILAHLTPAQMEKAAELDGVLQVSLGNPAYPLTSQARKVTGVDDIHKGNAGLDMAYTGKGVICGMMDTGLDHNHLNFLTEDGKPRITRIWEITSGGSTQIYDTPDEIKNKRTDSSNATHATHVLGIMAGSYKGTSKYADYNKIGRPSVLNGKNPFYGVATDAELAVSIGTLGGNNIELAAQYIKEYSKNQNKPAVFNLSLGNNLGPHDGTDAESKLLAEVGKDVLICISAGNEGGYPLSVKKTLTASDKELKTLLSQTGATPGGSFAEFWGDNSSALKASFAVINKSTGAVIKKIFTVSAPTGEAVFYGGSNYGMYQNVTVDADIDKYFGASALFSIYANVNSANNRYQVSTNFESSNNDNSVVLGFILEGEAGNTINGYSTITNGGFYSLNLPGYTKGDANNCINGMACGENVLVVGSYTNRSSWVTIDGGEVMYENPPVEGNISAFSSSGWTHSGRNLPDIVGPGEGMIASYSTPYMNKLEKGEIADQSALPFKYRSAEATNSVTGEKNYWMEMSGTSMSTPFVAGVLALWLEADPTLTMTRVKEILNKTATRDQFTAQNTGKWGMGKINAIEGLKEILGKGAVNSVEADATDNLIIESLGGKRFNVFVGGTDKFNVNLYNMQGALVANAVSDGNTVELDASDLAEGIYVVEVQGKNIHNSRKIVVK